VTHKHYLSALLCVVIILSTIFPAGALIKVEWTVKKLFAESKAVVSGKVVDIDKESSVVNVSLTKALKGKSPGPKIRVQIVAPPEVLATLAADQPLVLFVSETEGGGKSVIHVADTWLLANGVPNSNLLVWRVVQAWDAVKQSFPGRTAALAALVAELNAGTDTLINAWPHKPFVGGVKTKGKVPVQKATWMLADDLNGDKKPDLIVGSAAGTKVLLANGEAYDDATAAWGALGNAGGYHASGDANGDGKTDLLLDGALWLNQGTTFKAAAVTFDLPKGTPLASALIDVNGDQKLDAVFLSATGEMRIYENAALGGVGKTVALFTGGEAPTFAAFGDFGDTGRVHAMVLSKAGVIRYALDAAGGTPADLQRLTGVVISKNEKFKYGLKNPLGVALHMNGEGKPDLFVIAENGFLLLLNRGLGTFFLDETAAHTLTDKGPLPFKPTPATPIAKADLQGKNIDDLLVLGEDGTLYVLSNPR